MQLPDETMRISTEDGWNMADRLAAEEGLHVGHSSGANVFAALKIAEELLRDLMERVGIGGFFRPAPIALVHPVEMVEGGLSEVEERVFLELARGAGARKAVVYVGPDLGDDGVRAKLESA